MRIGAVWVPSHSAQYRVAFPLNALARRGHSLVSSPAGDGSAQLEPLSTCDVVHVYRRSDVETLRALGELTRRGIPITFDNDDDHTAVPKESPHYAEWSGVRGQQVFASTVRAARMARVFTTTSEVLADKYRRAGVERVEVIPNHLAPDVPRERTPHEGVVVGWIAGGEHYADVVRIDIVGALERLIAMHPQARVECIGVDLALSARYRHDGEVPFFDLPGRIGGFDVGIAPLADIACNRARSDIKVKEYAASGTAWLASPVGPYLGLGEEQGGRLVPNDRWYDALERMVVDPGERDRLGRQGAAWARTQTVDAVAERWERVLLEAAGETMPRVRLRARA